MGLSGNAPHQQLTCRIIGLAMEVHNGYFAALKQCPVALYFNFGRPRLEYHRLFPPKKVVAFQRQKWGKPVA